MLSGFIVSIVPIGTAEKCKNQLFTKDNQKFNFIYLVRQWLLMNCFKPK